MKLKTNQINEPKFKEIKKVDQNEEPELTENIEDINLFDQSSIPVSAGKLKQVILVIIFLALIFIQILYYSTDLAQKINYQQSSKTQRIKIKNLQNLMISSLQKQNGQARFQKNLSLLTTNQEQTTQTQTQPSQQLQDNAQKYLTPELKKVLKQGKYFDIHYFIQDKHIKIPPKVIHRPKQRNKKDEFNKKRSLINIQKNNEELEHILSQMKNPPTRPKKLPAWSFLQKQDPRITDLTFFASELFKKPENKEYLQAQYYYFDKNYNIGYYSQQLPLCVVMVGRNNANLIFKAYQSIKRQNYTNYKIVQVDDNSDDDTLQKTLKYLSQNQFLKDRTIVLTNSYERNALYNRHLANIQYCQDDEIIVDHDTDDFLIGNQVYQLINSLYQAGNIYKGKNQSIWSLFLNHISYSDPCCPYSNLFGQIQQKIIEEKVYRISNNWRTTHLRSYLRKLYAKIDPKDFIDPINIKKGEHYGEAQDLFQILPLWELSSPKHVKIIDQYVYYYDVPSQRDSTYPQYCALAGRNLQPYNSLQNLQDIPTRRKSLGNFEILQNQKKKVQKRFQVLKQKVLEIYEKNKKDFNH